MATFTNHVTLHAAANGTTSHTVDPSSGTVSTGTLFTPTAGRELVVITYGSVTSTTPTGWTLRASAVNSGGLYIWSRTAAGGDTFTTTHNGSNYEVGFTILEYPSGSTWVNSITATNTTGTGANPSLTGLTGTNWVAGAKGLNTNAAVSGAWTSPVVEVADINQTAAATDGYWLSAGYVEDSTASSFQPTCTRTGGVGSSESATFAVNVSSGGASYTASPSDNVGVTDGAERVVSAGRAPADPVGLTDSAQIVAAADRSVADPMGLTDSLQVSSGASVAPADSLGISDSVGLARSISLADAVGATDSAATVASSSITAADSVGVTDNVTVALSIARAIGDQIGATDSASADLTAPGSANIDDPLGVTDLLTTAAQILRSAGDSLGITDAVTAALERTSSPGDPVGISDSVTAQTGAAPSLADGLGISDSAVAVLERVVAIGDQVGALDSVIVSNPAIPPLPTTGVSLTASVDTRGLSVTAESRSLEVTT